jgi:hypothetical protein
LFYQSEDEENDAGYPQAATYLDNDCSHEAYTSERCYDRKENNGNDDQCDDGQPYGEFKGVHDRRTGATERCARYNKESSMDIYIQQAK